jgi:microsomal dipeptidase-like Zn-dependent dipeptidase
VRWTPISCSAISSTNNPDRIMSYFDFHLHAVFKKFICKFESSYPTQLNAGDLSGTIDLKNALLDFADEEFLHILESQSCITQLQKGNFVLGVAGIAPIEAAFTEREGLFGKLLNSKVTRPVDQKYFDSIRKGEISYYQLFIRELNLYKSLNDSGTLKILSRADGKLPAGNNMVFAIGMEGGHSLSRCKIRNPGVADALAVTAGKEDALSKDFKANALLSAAESLRNLQQAMWHEGMDLCYLILTHLTYIPEQLLATHAYGMKMIKNTAVYPRGNGISNAGKDVIDAAYSLTVKDKGGNTVPAPVLIDIKHMSLKSRLDFYDHRRKKKYDRFPILASHMGVTGYSVDEWKAALEEDILIREGDVPVVSIRIDRKAAGKWGLINKNFTYNAWSINMMDEDIQEVFNSKGIIGMSLDVRILGWQNILAKGDKDEILSWEDYRFLFPGRAAALAKGEVFVESFVKPTAEERHPLALCFNILHVVWVGKTLTAVDPWKHICIGSDFDGLIDPVVNCRDAEKYSSLQNSLLKWLPVAEKAYREETNSGPLLPADAKGAIDQAALKNIVADVMFNNGKQFMDNWVKGKFV